MVLLCNFFLNLASVLCGLECAVIAGKALVCDWLTPADLALCFPLYYEQLFPFFLYKKTQ